MQNIQDILTHIRAQYGQHEPAAQHTCILGQLGRWLSDTHGYTPFHAMPDLDEGTQILQALERSLFGDVWTQYDGATRIACALIHAYDMSTPDNLQSYTDAWRLLSEVFSDAQWSLYCEEDTNV
jgi:hypothetical protein